MVFDVLQAARLLFGQDGLAILHRSDGSEDWVNNIFDMVVLWDPESMEHLALRRSTQDLQALSDLLGKHRSIEVDTCLARTSAAIKLHVYRMLRATDGSKYFWSLPHLHKAIGSTGPAGRWYHKHWLDWVKFVTDRMVLPAIHCRRAQAVVLLFVFIVFTAAIDCCCFRCYRCFVC